MDNNAKRACEWENKPVLNSSQRIFHTRFSHNSNYKIINNIMQTFTFSLWTSPINLAHCDQCFSNEELICSVWNCCLGPEVMPLWYYIVTFIPTEFE